MKLMPYTVLAASALLIQTAFAAPTQELVFGFTALSVKSEAEIKNEIAQWQPMLDAMSKQLKVKVTGVGSTKAGDLVERMKKGEVHVALMGNVPALDALVQANAQVFGQVIKIKGGDSYQSLIIAHKDSKLTNLEQMLASNKQYSLQLGDVKSTSSTLVPLYYAFSRYRVTPEEVFKKVTRGNHKLNFLAVANKEVDVATVASDLLEGDYKEENAAEYAKVKVIWRSDPLKNDPLLYRKDLPADTKQAVEKFFLGYGKTPEEKATLKEARGLTGFKKSTNAQLQQVADIELFQAQQSLMQDEKLTMEEKNKKHEEVSRKFADLQRYLLTK